MTDKPQTHEQPAPRPPRQPDLALITYLERGGHDTDDTAEEPEAAEPQ